MIKHPSAARRWEAIKALGRIADLDSMSLFIAALCDKDEEVRWLAAEGLIALGAPTREPLLRVMVKNSKPARLRRGAHHYFRAMREIGRGYRGNYKSAVCSGSSNMKDFDRNRAILNFGVIR